ncbi:hypothetical protein BsWGS_11384 [Bradybaena similaris]
MGDQDSEPVTPAAPAVVDREDNNACVQWCFTEFQSDNITLDHERPSDFVTSQWAGRPRAYIIYRIVVGLALLGWVSGDVVYETNEFYMGEAWRWLVFASNWSFAILAISAVFQAVTSTIYEYQPYWIMDPIYIRAMPVVLKLQWILFNISCNSALVVTTGYWAFIAFVSNTPLLTSDMSRLKHTVNSIYVIADVLIVATPVRMYHMFFTAFLGSLYIVFNALYYINNGSLLFRGGVGLGGRTYYFMNWSQPVEAICTCVLGVIMSAAAQIVLHGLFQFRVWLHQRMYPNQPRTEAELQNIITTSISYNSLEDSYGERPYGGKKPR